MKVKFNMHKIKVAVSHLKAYVSKPTAKTGIIFLMKNQVTIVSKYLTKEREPPLEFVNFLKQYSAKFENFQNMKFTELSQGVFTFMNIYIILTFFGHYSMLTAEYCVYRTCVNCSLPGYTPDFSGYNAVKTVVNISVSNQ